MIVFENEGLIDLDAIRIQGVSVKEGENRIGKFGTGIKYAFAVLLREECTIDLYRGLSRIPITSRKKEIRGKEFDVVYLGEEQLSFTTHYGINWKPWQAFRELYCNAHDEDGKTYASKSDKMVGKKGHTRIVVRGRPIEEAYVERTQTILESSPNEVSSGVEIHMGKAKRIFYRGIRAMDIKTESLYTYNILSESYLTEERMLASEYTANAHITRAITQSTNETFLEEILSTKGSFEASLNYEAQEAVNPSQAFLNVATDLFNQKRLIPSVRKLFSKYVERYTSLREYRETRLTKFQEQLFLNASEIVKPKLEQFGLSDKYPKNIYFEVKESDQPRLSAVVNGELFVDIRHFSEGTDHLAAVILHAILVDIIRGRTDYTLVRMLMDGTVAPYPEKFQKTYEIDDMPF